MPDKRYNFFKKIIANILADAVQIIQQEFSKHNVPNPIPSLNKSIHIPATHLKPHSLHLSNLAALAIRGARLPNIHGPFSLGDLGVELDHVECGELLFFFGVEDVGALGVILPSRSSSLLLLLRHEVSRALAVELG